MKFYWWVKVILGISIIFLSIVGMIYFSNQTEIKQENSVITTPKHDRKNSKKRKVVSPDKEIIEINKKEKNDEDLKKRKNIKKELKDNVKKSNIDPTKPMVALTFDDGPNPVSTPHIIEILKNNHAKATFFDLGVLILNYPDIVKNEESIGCEVGSHTFDHIDLNKLDENGIKYEIEKSKEAFNLVLGHDFKLLRAPYGNINDLVKNTINYPLINWNVDTLDWKIRNKDAIINELRNKGDLNGKIILMHSIYSSTADAMEVMVPELIQKGYQLVTVSELFEAKGVDLKSGTIYYGF